MRGARREDRVNRDHVSWRDRKRLPRLLNMEQRPGQEQEQRGEEIRGKGKGKEGKEQKKEALNRRVRKMEEGRRVMV